MRVLRMHGIVHRELTLTNNVVFWRKGLADSLVPVGFEPLDDDLGRSYRVLG